MADEIQSVQPENTSRFLTFLKNYQHTLWWGLGLLAALTAGLLIYILFIRGAGQVPEFEGDAEISITAPEEAPSGGEVFYEINYQNTSNAILTDVILEIFYPRGFEFVDATPDPDDESGRKFTLPDLVSQKKGKLAIVGRLQGSLQEVQTVAARLHYVPQNFRSVFAVEARAATTVLAPDITIQMSGPDQIVSGQNGEFEVKITNLALKDFSNLVLVMSYPDNFETDAETEFSIPALGVGSEHSIQFTGKILTIGGTEAILAAELFAERQGERFSAGRSFIFTAVSPSPLKLSHSVLQPKSRFFPGDEVRYEVSYENLGQVALSDVTISLVFETPVFDLSQAVSVNGQISQNSFVWIPSQVSDLRVLNPGQKGSFNVRLRLLDSQKNPLAKTRVQYVSRELAEPLTGNALSFEVGTVLDLAATAQYISGPNPPEAGIATVYRVEFAVTNSVNDIRDAILTARIPRADGVADISTVIPVDEAGNVNFSPTAGVVTWNLGKIFAFTGSVHAKRSMSLDIKITPSISESRFSRITVMSGVELSGIDDFTGDQVNAKKIGDLTVR